MSKIKNKCWADYFGGCKGGLTAEHLVSKSLFPEGKLYIEGFEWCKEGKVVGINSITRRILCKKHNNDLSILDSEAKYAINCFQKGESSRPINGLLFERWLLKTAINLSIGCGFHIGMGFSDSHKGYPSPYAIALAFAKEPFKFNMGMYVLENKEIPSDPNGHLMMPITKGEEIGIFLFGLRGVHILLNLVPAHSIPKLSNINLYDSLPIEVKDSKPIYRPSGITFFNTDKEVNTAVDFVYM